MKTINFINQLQEEGIIEVGSNFLEQYKNYEHVVFCDMDGKVHACFYDGDVFDLPELQGIVEEYGYSDCLYNQYVIVPLDAGIKDPFNPNMPVWNV